MGRIRRPFERPEGKKEAKLIVIATEGRKTERIYFEKLAEVYESSNVHVKILEKLDDRSSPEDVLKQLDEFALEYHLDEEDELWMVIDRDFQSWTVQTIRTVAQKCHQKKGYYLGLSNPAFELWLILHYEDISAWELKAQEDLLANRKQSQNKTYSKKFLSKRLGGFNEAKYDPMLFVPHVSRAIQYAKHLDLHPRRRWPNYLATRLYRLAEKIIY